MTLPITSSAPNVTSVPTGLVDVPPGSPVEAPKKIAPKDVFETGTSLDIYSVHTAKAVAPTEGILSSFPTDLSELRTHDRWAAGFRLDGGSLRLMWMSARRVLESDGMPGVEVFFWLNGNSVDVFAKRMQDKGAKLVDFPFFEGYPPDGVAPDKSFLKRTGQKWSPSSTQVLQYVDPGKCCVDFCTSSPEALRGAMRVRVYGSDADASKALASVQKTLGLQGLFAPPNPKALNRLKLLSVLSQVSASAAERLRWRAPEMIPSETLEAALDKAGQHPGEGSLAAIANANLEDALIARRVNLAQLLLSRSAPAFLGWAKSDTSCANGILPTGPTNDYGINNALAQIGVPATSPEYLGALAKAPSSAEDTRRLLQLGLLAKSDEAAARTILSVDLESIKVDQIEAALVSSGIDPTGDRVANLRFEEVYPGYFTVIDPALPELCREAGARYAYSTLDNPERVWQALTGGQKSSLTRFQEGMLVQGKSTNSDFGTGGAASVFTRLVTESAIEKGLKFQDWSGTRPFKLILNREVLGRTDWYGYNGDRFGRTTGLTDDNHGPKVCATIDANYAANNELCFPIGNDSAFVDFVVCDSEQRKNELINYLKSRGLNSHNGKPLEEIVRVASTFFELPNDITVEKSARQAAKDAARLKAKPAADEAAKLAVTNAFTPEAIALAKTGAAATLKKQFEGSIKSSGEYAAANAVRNLLAASWKDNVGPAIQAAGLIPDSLVAEARQVAIDAAVKQVDASTWFHEWAVKNAATEAAVAYLVEKTKPKYVEILGSLLTDQTRLEATDSARLAAEATAKTAVSSLDYQAQRATRESLQSTVEAAVQDATNKAAKNAAVVSALEAAKAAAKSFVDSAKTGADDARKQALDSQLATLDFDALVDKVATAVAIEVTPQASSAAIMAALGPISDSISKGLGQQVLSETLPDAVKGIAADTVQREAEKYFTTMVRQVIDGVLAKPAAEALEAAKAHQAAKTPA